YERWSFAHSEMDAAGVGETLDRSGEQCGAASGASALGPRCQSGASRAVAASAHQAGRAGGCPARRALDLRSRQRAIRDADKGDAGARKYRRWGRIGAAEEVGGETLPRNEAADQPSVEQAGANGTRRSPASAAGDSSLGVH